MSLVICISSYQVIKVLFIFEFLLSVSLQCIAIGTCIVGRQAPRVLGIFYDFEIVTVNMPINL